MNKEYEPKEETQPKNLVPSFQSYGSMNSIELHTYLHSSKIGNQKPLFSIFQNVLGFFKSYVCK